MDKRDFLKVMGAGAVAGIAGGLMSGATLGPGGTRSVPVSVSPGVRETSFERIQRTQTIRVSYAPYAPNVMVDPNTRQMSGIFYDIVNLIGQYLGLRIEWAEEVGWGEIAQGFKSGKHDLCGANVWPTGPRALQGNFSTPCYFSAAYAFVRKNETRFKSYDDLNHPDVRIAVQDDDGITDIAKSLFPRATLVSFPQMVDTKQRLIDVANGKADVTFDDAYYAQLFLDQNPGQLKRLPVANPLQVFANTLMFDNDDWRMKVLLDTAINELQNAGTMTRLVEKYTGRKDAFLPVTKPYDTGAML